MISSTATLVVPLGGLGEVGLNALLLETASDAVLVDCGLLFPPSPALADYWIPDLSCLAERREKLRAVVLTHGHDDHVGALPHLLRAFPVPVYGTPFTLALAEERLRGAAPGSRALLRKVDPGRSVDLGSIRALFLHVTHSVPDTAALVLETVGGTIVHTGDFKFDLTPVDGRLTDEGALARWGDRGVDLLCCDSTGAGRAGATPSERAVRAAFGRIFAEVEGRVHVVTFASHVHRVQQVLEACRSCGRQTALLGPRLVAAARAGRRLGVLRPAPGDLVPERGLARLPRRRQALILAGSQGEPGSAFYRVARGLAPLHRILPGDEVVLSARTIPGNENAIEALVRRVVDQGARVHRGEEAGTHVSGHGSAGDVRRMLDLTRPRNVLPVHGELRHRDAMSRVALAWGLSEHSVFRTGNGQSLLLDGQTVRPGPLVGAGRMAVDRGVEVPPDDPLLTDRAEHGRDGVAEVTVRRPRGGAPWEARVCLRGVAPAAATAEAEREAEVDLCRRLAEDVAASGAQGEVAAAAARALLRHFRRRGRGRPSVRVAVAPDVDASEPGPLE